MVVLLFYVAVVSKNNYILLTVVIQVVNCTKTCGNVLQSDFWDAQAAMLRRQLRENDNGHCGNLPYIVVDVYSIGGTSAKSGKRRGELED